jgi:hypothetical protein
MLKLGFATKRNNLATIRPVNVQYFDIIANFMTHFSRQNLVLLQIQSRKYMGRDRVLED